MGIAWPGSLGRTVHRNQMSRLFWNTDDLAMNGSSFAPYWRKGKRRFMINREAVINHQLSPEVVVTRFQGLISTALAMLGRHISWSSNVSMPSSLEIALLKPRDQHLRSPSLTEILDADRVAWTAVVELLSDSKWSLNDVLNEVAFCRQVFHTSLGPKAQTSAEPQGRPTESASRSFPNRSPQEAEAGAKGISCGQAFYPRGEEPQME